MRGRLAFKDAWVTVGVGLQGGEHGASWTERGGVRGGEMGAYACACSGVLVGTTWGGCGLGRARRACPVVCEEWDQRRASRP